MKIEKVKNRVTSLHNKTEYVIYIRNLKDHRVNKVHRVIIINQKVF